MSETKSRFDVRNMVCIERWLVYQNDGLFIKAMVCLKPFKKHKVMRRQR